MNHLAHLFLAGESVDSMIGNLAGDFVKGPLGDRFPPAIAAGILEHRRIDAFTDAHPAAGAFRRIIAAEQGHYARVVADIFFDHFLACLWSEYCAQPLPQYLEERFLLLDPHIARMPGRLPHVYRGMRSGWLLSYATLDGMWTALFHTSHRFTRGPRLEMAVHFLVDARQELEQHFRLFFPEVMRFARSLR